MMLLLKLFYINGTFQLKTLLLSLLGMKETALLLNCTHLMENVSTDFLTFLLVAHILIVQSLPTWTTKFCRVVEPLKD